MSRRAATPLPSDLVLALVLVAFVGLPFIATFFSGTRSAVSTAEHRRLARLPEWPRGLRRIKAFPGEFDAYARDHFGFRDELLAGYKFILADVFRQSASDGVIVGRRGWLYTTEDDALKDMRGADPYTPSQVRNAVQQIIARGDLLTARHIRYAFIMAPDKHTVYPEFLPRGVYAGLEHRRLQALDQAMADTGRQYYFDLTDAMRGDVAGSRWPLYYKGDTHWNVWGAYLGYETLAARFRGMGLHSVRYRFDQFRQPGPANRRSDGDLARMSGVAPVDPDIWPPANMPCYPLLDWPLPTPLQQRLGVSAPQLRTTANCDRGTGTALVIHDSFMDNMAWHVSANFARTDYVWKYLDDGSFATLVRYVRPDVVLVERVERLMRQFPSADVEALVAQLGLIGEPARVAADGDLVIGLPENQIVRHTVKAGTSIDRVYRSGNGWRIEGWANMGARPPAAIIAVDGGKIVAESPFAEYRPDVARGTGNRGMAWSGFALQLPGDMQAAQIENLHFYCIGYDTYGTTPVAEQIRQRLPDSGPHD